MDRNGWADTGQHFTITIDGICLEGRHGSLAALLAGHCIRGAHAADTGVDDNDSWGTEHEGTYNMSSMPLAQWSASVQLHAAISFCASSIRRLSKGTAIPAAAPLAAEIGWRRSCRAFAKSPTWQAQLLQW